MSLREEIGQITNVINANQKQLDTYVAAFNWYSQQLEAAKRGATVMGFVGDLLICGSLYCHNKAVAYM
jgi:hypothetical protein